MKEHDKPSGIFGKFFTIARRVNSYRKEFKNYTSVIYHMVREKYPFVARLRDGTHVKVYSLNELFMIISGMGTSNVVYDERQHVTKINYKEKEIALFGAENNGDIPSVFFTEEYKFLEPMGNVVLDVGANIGDSVIYFLVNGASRVIAFEPYEFSYKNLVKNVEACGFLEKVEAIKAGISTKDSSLSIPREYHSSTGAKLQQRSGKDTEEVPVYSLKTIFDKYQIKDAVMKMDCEGCEYDSIVHASDDML